MRLDPVYLVAPRPAAPSMTRRRAFAGMGLCIFVGATVGGACGYSLGAAAGEGKDRGGGDDDLEKTGNAELDELRRLAVKAPVEELLGRMEEFMVLRNRRYTSDEVLWRGLIRLADHLVADPSVPNRRVRAMLLLQTLEQNDPPRGLSPADQVEALRSIR